MLFNSYAFLFVFFPVTAFGFFAIGHWSERIAALWLAGASLLFYGWWNVAYVPLLLGSIAFNWLVGLGLARLDERYRRGLVVVGIAGDLLLLAYFKYAGFLVETANGLGALDLTVPKIILPLGISFFTFTQIGFVVDCYRRKAREYDPVHYLLFVTYFPHLIAGPIIHHADVMPQFAKPGIYRPRALNIATGLVFLSVGLFKKMGLADVIGPFADTAFGASQPGLWEAWGGALSYTLQIYFDFSGYSDMAVGLSLMLGIRLPFNFNSPYKAGSIIEFWRRWHMTLSAFLRDYVYFPLGGNRKGPLRRYVNLMATMLIGGLWHGAGWTFVLWGALHGFYLLVNHAWRGLRRRQEKEEAGQSESRMVRLVAQALTFLCVVIAWVFFRAPQIGHALEMLRGMVGLNGAGARIGGLECVLIAALSLIIWAAPNTQELVQEAGSRRPTLLASDAALAMFAALLFVVAILQFGTPSSFLYFNF